MACNLIVAAHCWTCGPAEDQDACDRELHYLECPNYSYGQPICITVNGLSQKFYMRTCQTDYDYEWDRRRCASGGFAPYGKRSGIFCDIAKCPGDCFANIKNEGKRQITLVENKRA